MTKLTVGKKVASSKQLKDLRGSTVVLYFYPKDDTSGCTAEGLDFKAKHSAFKRAGATVLGVSRDSPRSHERFRTKFGFPFALVSDEDETLCKAFDVIKMKSLYGRKYLGVERSTFLIAPDGTLAQEWRKVKVAGHADEVLAAAQALGGKPRPARTKRPAKPAKRSKRKVARRGAGR